MTVVLNGKLVQGEIIDVYMKMTSETKKRKNTSVDLETKIRALNDYNHGKSKYEIAKELGVNISTVKTWVQNEGVIRQWYTEHGDLTISKKKRLRRPNNEIIDIATWMWFKERRRAGCPITGSLIKVQALRFWQLLGATNKFEASHGWLTRWRERHGIKILPSDEKSSSNEESTNDYSNEFLSNIENEHLGPDQVFNCAETCLNFRQIPNPTLTRIKDEFKESSSIDQNDRITIMSCSNASGTLKLPLVIVGKLDKSLALDNSISLNVSYKMQKSSWITNSTFKKWFHEEFVPTVRSFLLAKALPVRAILFMDNCGSYPQILCSEDIRVKYFSQEITPVISPMDQGCLQTIKKLYRMRLITFILDKLENHMNLAGSLKMLTIREVILWVSNAWMCIETTTIVKSWQALWPKIAEILQTIEVLDFVNVCDDLTPEFLTRQFYDALRQQIEYQNLDISVVDQWLYPSSVLTEEECFGDNETLESVANEENEEKENESTELQVTNEITNSEMTNYDTTNLIDVRFYLDKVIKHCEGNPVYTSVHVLALKSIQDIMRLECLMPNK